MESTEGKAGDPTIDERVTEIEQLLAEVMARLLYTMQTMQVQVTEFAATLGPKGERVPVSQRSGSLLDFYMDAQKKKELLNATQK